MKPHFFLALFTFVLLSTAQAQAASPYIGGSLQLAGLGEVNPKDAVHSDTSWRVLISNGFGGEVEAGWMGSFWQVGLGYRHSGGGHSSPTTANYVSGPSSASWDVLYRDYRWTSDRISLGSLLRLADRAPGTVTPLFGGGISLGWVSRSCTWHSRHVLAMTSETVPTSGDVEQISKASPGLYLETGLGVRIRSRWLATLTLRYDHYALKLPYDASENLRSTSNVFELGLRLKAAYRFGSVQVQP